MTTQASDGAPNERARILRLLLDAAGGEVSPREILDLRISQYGSRIDELRTLGCIIINRTETVNGVGRSWFRLVRAEPVDRLEAAPE